MAKSLRSRLQDCQQNSQGSRPRDSELARKSLQKKNLSRGPSPPPPETLEWHSSQGVWHWGQELQHFLRKVPGIRKQSHWSSLVMVARLRPLQTQLRITRNRHNTGIVHSDPKRSNEGLASQLNTCLAALPSRSHQKPSMALTLIEK